MKKGIVTLMSVLLLSATAFGQHGMKKGQSGGFDGDRGGRRHGQVCDCRGRFDRGQHGDGFEGRGGANKGGLGHIMAMADILELSDQQVDQLKESMVAFQLEQIDQQAELKKAKIQLRVLKHDQDASEAAVMKGIDKVSGLKAEMHKMKYRHHKKAKSILTDEQREKLGKHGMKSNEDSADRSFKQRRRFGG